MKLSERDRRVAAWGAAVLAGIVAARFVLAPWLDGWSEARSAVEANRVALASLEGQLSRAFRQREALGRRYGRGVGEPARESQAAAMALLGAAQEALKANGFTASNYTPQAGRPIRELPGMQAVKLQVQGQCDEAAVGRCLAALRGGKVLVMVESLSMTGDAKNPGRLEVTMTLSTPARKGRSER